MDEFYTLRSSVDEMIDLNPGYWRNKVVYCPCDTAHSEIVRAFLDRFEELGLRTLCFSHISVPRLYYSDGTRIRHVDDFDSDYLGPDVYRYLKDSRDSDFVVVTNPPFSTAKSFDRLLAGLVIPLVHICPDSSFDIRNILFIGPAVRAFVDGEDGTICSMPSVWSHWITTDPEAFFPSSIF